jgi:putative Ca2+/H+ antiporter (TMEM165/GDT1 family)
VSAFAVIALAEFGDKTQIAVINLSAKHRPKSVFVGAMLAFALVNGISALVGGTIASLVPTFWISLVGGISFLTFGAYTLFSKKNLVGEIKGHSKTVTATFMLIAIAEFGDKTQLAVIALSAQYGAPLQVFVGTMLAMTFLTAVGSVFGKIISRYISARYIRIGASLIFLAFGILFLFEAFNGIKTL